MRRESSSHRGAAPASRPLAAAAFATCWADLPPDVRQQATDLFLDTLAVIAAGSVEPGHRAWLAAHAGEQGPCTAIGLPGGVSAASAGQLNGGATTVLQWQDGHRMGRGHPASHLVPALLALAEQHSLAADAVMSAFVGGYEVGARVGVALGGLSAPLHDVGTWPTLGTAAGCAMLLGGDAGVIAEALESAAALAPLPWRETAPQGATAHHLYAGTGITSAMAAGRAAVAGFTGLPGTIEAFFGPRAGAAFDPARLLAGIGADGRWSCHELLNAYFKLHPVCAHFSSLADVLGELCALRLGETGRPLERDEVIEVEVALFAAALVYDAAVPASDLAARFSPAAIAYAALGHLGLYGPGLAEVVAGDPAALAWMSNVQVSHDPALDAGYPVGRPVRVRLKLADGTVMSASAQHAYGDSTRPMSATDRAAKVEAGLQRRFGADGERAVRAAFRAWLDGGAIGDLSRALRRPVDRGHLSWRSNHSIGAAAHPRLKYAP